MRTLSAWQGGNFLKDLEPDALRDLLLAPDTVIWLDIQSPDDEDVKLLRDKFEFHPLAIEDAKRPEGRPKVNIYKPTKPSQPEEPEDGKSEGEAPASPKDTGYYFVVFNEAHFDQADKHIVTQTVNMFIGQNYLVTVHPGEIHKVQDTLSRWQEPGGPPDNTVGGILHAFLDAIVDEYFPLMDRVSERVEELENSIFKSFNEGALQSLFSIKKDLLTMRRIAAPERDALHVLLRQEIPIFEPENVAYLQDVYDHIVRVTENIDTYRDLLSSVLDAYLSIQSNYLNQIVKVLTTASIILMVASLITSFYGMNADTIPGVTLSVGSLWTLSLIAVSTVVLVTYFKRKGWL